MFPQEPKMLHKLKLIYREDHCNIGGDCVEGALFCCPEPWVTGIVSCNVLLMILQLNVKLYLLPSRTVYLNWASFTNLNPLEVHYSAVNVGKYEYQIEIWYWQLLSIQYLWTAVHPPTHPQVRENLINEWSGLKRQSSRQAPHQALLPSTLAPAQILYLAFIRNSRALQHPAPSRPPSCARLV